MIWRLEPGDPGYPEQLLDLGEPVGPRSAGSVSRAAVAGLEPGDAVTIVGSRRASGYGLRVAEGLAHDLAGCGVVVVSGMALGIDAAAHRGALDAGGRTIAVLAGGPDVVYPARHRGLHARICARGAVISDRPAGDTAAEARLPGPQPADGRAGKRRRRGRGGGALREPGDRQPRPRPRSRGRRGPRPGRGPGRRRAPTCGSARARR